jgi:integrase/recombinase XerD
MDKAAMLGPWVRPFLLEHLVGERNLAANTQRSYRDTLVLLLPFVAEKVGKAVDRLSVVDLSAELIRRFLAELESSRGCAIVTRNQRLAAIHALARFVGEHSPEHVSWCAQLRAIPFKKPAARAVVPYLDKAEMQALLAAPDQQTAQGRRDHALLLFLYNSGARAQEAAGLLIADLELRTSYVTLLGKGSKKRQCPLWPVTVRALSVLTVGRPASDPVFLNRCGRALTRFGIHTLVERYAAKVQSTVPSLANKRVSPHTLRHYLSNRTMSDTGTPAQYLRQLREAAHDIVLTPSVNLMQGKGVHREVYDRLPSSSFASARRPSRVSYRAVCEVTE